MVPGKKPFATQYDPKENKEWKSKAAFFFAQAMDGQDPLSGPVHLSVGAHFAMPKSHHRKRLPRPQEMHVKKPDLDNVVKAVKDAAKGVLWFDDTQVCYLVAWKLTQPQGVAPYTTVEVQEIADLWTMNGTSKLIPVLQEPTVVGES